MHSLVLDAHTYTYIALLHVKCGKSVDNLNYVNMVLGTEDAREGLEA